MQLVHNDFAGALLLIGSFLLITLGCEVLTRLRRPDPELARKSVHVLGGLGCLLFPFFVRSPLVVLFMACLFALSFYLGEKTGLLQCLTGVVRESQGGEYFPFAVFAIFSISQNRLWLYFVSLLILTVADAGAALIGSRYGKIRFEVAAGESKSLEGSLIFWSISLLVVTCLLGAMTDLSWPASLLSAYLVASILTGIEAISIKGTDNIFVPILTCYILLKITTKPVPVMVFQAFSFSAMFLFSLAWNHIVKIFVLRDAILFTIFSYAAWSLGSIDWFLPIATAFLLYSLLRIFTANEAVYRLETAALFRVLMIPFCILFLANWFDLYEALFGPYLLAVTMTCTLGSWSYLLTTHKMRKGWRWPTATLLSLMLGLVITVSNVFTLPKVPLDAMFFIPVTTIGLVLVYDRYLGNRFQGEGAIFRAEPIWILTSIAAIAYWSLQSADWLQLWHPSF